MRIEKIEAAQVAAISNSGEDRNKELQALKKDLETAKAMNDVRQTTKDGIDQAISDGNLEKVLGVKGS